MAQLHSSAREEPRRARPPAGPAGALRHADARRDGSACAAIYAPHVAAAATSFEERPPDAAEMCRRIEQTSATHPWLVLERDGRVVGFAYACPHRTRPAYRWAADVSIYVADGERRSGAGRALYGALFGLLRRQGIRNACAGITLPNDASVGLHEALGFRRVGVYRGIGWKAGAWRDVGIYQLDLGAPAGAPPPHPLGPPRLGEEE